MPGYTLLDGKATAAQIKKEIAKEVADIIDKEQRAPHLAAILVGDDPASHIYVKNKEKDCQEVGITSSVYTFPVDVTERELLNTIDFLNHDDEVDGFIVQLPLPDHIDNERVLLKIDPKKDVDGFHPMNIGRMTTGVPAYFPATPNGIMQILERYNIETEGKNCVVLGRSNIVGTPMGILMSRKAKPGNATVTIFHSKSKNLLEVCKNADILIAAIGQAGYVTGEMIKKDAVVIDVGMHRVDSTETKSGKKFVGDVRFEEAAKKAKYITPVPGGVGPMTRVALLINTMKSYKREIYF